MKNGEKVVNDFFGDDMEWVDTDDAIERLDVSTFLGRFGDTIAHCTMIGEDGDIFALDDHSVGDEAAPLSPYWRAADPDQILVRKFIARIDMGEPERLTKENDFMRKLLADADVPCVYCGLSRADLGRCESGFPGCARADDMVVGAGEP